MSTCLSFDMRPSKLCLEILIHLKLIINYKHFRIFYTIYHSFQLSFHIRKKYMKKYIYIYKGSINIKRFIIRNWLTRLWSLISPMICCQQAKDPSEPVAQFQSESEGLRTWRVNIPVQKQSKKKNKLLPTLHFILFRPATDWIRSIHTGESRLLYSVYSLKH